MENYQAYIRNITTNEWLKSEGDSKVEHTKDENKKLVFYDETDAESTLEYLNMDFSDAYVLLIENDVTKLHNQDEELLMENSAFKEAIESIAEEFRIRIHEDEDYIELETWTIGGVNMFINVHKGGDKSHLEQFREYVLSFDIDEQIDVHRQDESYKNNFTIRESVHDFEAYENKLKLILLKIDNF